jgi:deoxyribose-phosphate aldolase
MKPNKKAGDMTMSELAAYIDYSVLKPEFTEEEIVDLTKDGVRLGCATICINSGYLDLCEPYVKGSVTMLCPVCDFPFGTSSTESKVKQIEIAARYDTVKEIDVVANFGQIRGGMYDKVTEDIKACADAAHRYGRKLKVIFEEK